MNVAVFHGSPRKGNTYKATSVFMEEMEKHGDVNVTEFFLPKAMPEFCTGCQMCLIGPNGNCPHAGYTNPVLASIMESDALVFATPHYGACSMSGAMKNMLDHLDFLTMNVAPRKEVFQKKAFIISTGSGSTAANKPIKKYLVNWGINRVNTLGIRMFTNKWDSMTDKKQQRHERRLRKAAGRFYSAKKKAPYLSAVFMYHMSKFILKRYVGEGAYPFKYWKEQGFFSKRPF